MAILLRHNEISARNPDNRAISLRSQITNIFTQWDMRTSVWMGLDKSLMSMVVEATSRNQVPALTNLPRRSLLGPRGFMGLGHAMKAQRQLITSCMSLNYSISYWSARDDDDSMLENLDLTRIDLLKEIDRWQSAFDTMLLEISPNLHEIDKKCVALLDISTRALRLRLLTQLQPDEDAIYETQTNEFSRIMDLAETLLFPTNIMRRIRAGEKGETSAAEELPMAYFNLGLMQALYHVAVKCADKKLRERAVEWMEREPWDEGGFNSAQAARIARKAMGLPDQMQALKLEQEVQPPGYYHHAHMVPMIADRS